MKNKRTKNLNCEVCDFYTSSKNYLQTHIESVHEGKKPHKCSICKACFLQNSNLQSHI